MGIGTEVKDRDVYKGKEENEIKYKGHIHSEKTWRVVGVDVVRLLIHLFLFFSCLDVRFGITPWGGVGSSRRVNRTTPSRPFPNSYYVSFTTASNFPPSPTTDPSLHRPNRTH